MTPRALLLGSFLFVAVVAQAQSLQVGPLQPLSDDVLHPAAGAQSLPAIAAGRDGFFAAWSDHRAGNGVNADVYAARISTDGSVLDPSNLPVVPTHTEDVDASVVWNGDRYVVVYSSLYFELGLTAVEYDEDGRTTNGRPILRPRGGTSQSHIAWNGREYLVAWRQSNAQATESETHAMLLDTSLAPIGEELVVSKVGGLVNVASNGDGFLVTVGDRSHAYAIPVTSAGIVGTSVDLGSTSGDAEVASNGDVFFVGRVSDHGITVTRISGTGAVIDEAIVSTATTIAESHVAIAWAGDRLITVAANHGSGTPGSPKHLLDILAVDAELKPLDGITVPEQYTSGQLFTHLELAATNGVATLVYATAYSTYEIEAIQFDSRSLGSLMTGGRRFPVSKSITRQRQQGGVWGGNSWGAVWLEDVDDATSHLYFGRVSPAGIRADGSGVDLGLYDGATISSNAHYFLIVAYRLGALYAIRVSFDGSLLDAAPIRIATGANASAATIPVVASAPDGSFLVAWATSIPIGQPNYTRGDTWAAVMTSDGRVLPPQQISPPVGIDTSYTPSGIAWSDAEYHVAVTRAVVPSCASRLCQTTNSVAVLRVTAGGTVIGSPVEVVTSTSGPGASRPRIASSGNGSLIAYLVFDLASSRMIARYKVLDRDASPRTADSSSLGLALDPAAEFLDVAFDGRNYVIAESKFVDNAALRSLAVFTVAPDGDRAAERGAEVSGIRWESAITVAGSPYGRALLLHGDLRELTPEAHPGGILRAVARLLGYGRRRAA